MSAITGNFETSAPYSGLALRVAARPEAVGAAWFTPLPVRLGMFMDMNGCEGRVDTVEKRTQWNCRKRKEERQ